MDNLQNDYSIIFSHVQKAYGSNVVINDLNLEIKKGERLILLGPSGCGKTTTLRMIAGFEEITKGELYMDGRVVNDIAPGERNIAMVCTVPASERLGQHHLWPAAAKAAAG